MADATRLPRVATIATMPSRIETLQTMLPAIHAQVDRLFVYLDGFDAVPDFLQGLERVTIRRAEETGNLHASSRFLCLGELSEPAIIAAVDDDILYPPDYIARMGELLDNLQGNALIGVHGRIFVPPHRFFARDALMFHFTNAVDKPRHVHEVGTGTCAFRSDRLPVDPASWHRNDMDDIFMALEAQRRGLPRIIIDRPADWLKPLAQAQPDSLWQRTLKDDAEQSRLMRTLLGLYA